MEPDRASTVSIRPFRPEELPRLKEITVEAFENVSIDRNIEQHFGPINGHSWGWRKARHLDQDVRRDSDGIFVAEVAGQIVGYITTWIDQEAGIGNIPNMALSQTHRGQGIGRKLLEHAIAHFRRQGARLAKIETLEQNPIGQHLYPSLGFQEVARQIHFAMPLDDTALAQNEAPPDEEHRLG